MLKLIKMDESATHGKIVEMLKGKSCLKQDVFSIIKSVFGEMKTLLEAYCEKLQKEVCTYDDRIRIEYRESGDFVCEVTIAGDLLVFVMHSNVSQFEGSHEVWRTSYMKEDENRGYSGTILIYNFLADSFRQNRVNDVGYLIGRLFVNKDRHFFVQGKHPLGLLFNDFVNDELNTERLQDVIETAILYTLDFDLYSPPYQQVQEVSVMEMMQINQSTFFKTGKRVGYRFQTDADNFES